MEKTVDVSQASKRLNVSRSTIYRLINEGKLPASKLGTVYCIRIRLEDIEAYQKYCQMDLIPGFYCGTTDAVYRVNYCDVPNVKIYNAERFFHERKALNPGQRIYGEFTLEDSDVWRKSMNK